MYNHAKNTKICEKCNKSKPKIRPVTEVPYLACTEDGEKWIFEVEDCPLRRWKEKRKKEN